MGRGITLGCERCDFAATLWERVPYVLDDAGNPIALDPAATGMRPAGYWSDWLCGQCLSPSRLNAPMDASADDAPTCPECGAPLLSFALAAEELALAAHSRAWLDLRGERDTLNRLRRASQMIPSLEADLASGEQTTLSALDEIVSTLTAEPLTSDAVTSLGGIIADIENALTLADAAHRIDAREDVAAHEVARLERLIDDEAALPGVPCPQCNGGQLIHWPVWQ